MARRRFAAVPRGWLAAARGATHVRARAAAVAGALVLAAGGCGGGGSLEASTTPLPAGTQVGAHRYLADSAGAAAAVRDFATVLEGIPEPATPAALQRAGERLREQLMRAERISARLSAARLADQRLERQRARASGDLAAAVATMRRVTEAAEAGDARAAARAADDLRRRLSALRAGAGGAGPS
jgi:hypothetical protein